MGTSESNSEKRHPLKLGPFSAQKVLVALIGWLLIYGLGSILDSNPFWTETAAGADINYGHVMYLHGLLIALVCLITLLACHNLTLCIYPYCSFVTVKSF